MRRLVILLLCLGLAASGCSDETAPPKESSAAPTTAAETPPPPPSPAERLGLEGGWGPTDQELERAARIARSMSLPNLAGQVIVAEWRGTAAPVSMIRRLHLGGVIAFSDNVSSPAQIRRVNATLTRGVRRQWPLFLAVDQEGGIVERVRGDLTRFPTFMSAGAADDEALTSAAAAASAAELRGLGFTVDFAPVADVTSGPGDPTIGSRSVGSTPKLVSAHVAAALNGFTGAAVVPVLKHFPGHGSVPQDSHQTLPVQTRSLTKLRAIDFAPFRSAIEAGAPAVMMGHLDVRALDPRVPSSMSKKIVTGVLREELGFNGLVVTDSLTMNGVRRKYDAGRSAVQGLRAGNDVLLMPPSPEAARRAIVAAVKKGSLKRSRVEQAAARQIALLLHHRGSRQQRRGKPPGSGREASRALSAGAITMVAGECGTRVVGEAVSPSGDPVAVANFASAARSAGLTVLMRRAAPARLTDAAPRPKRKKRERPKAYAKRLKAWKKAERRRRAALASFIAAEDRRLAAGTAIGFTGFQDAPRDGEVAVATNTPYVLGSLGAPVKVATYGDTPGAMSVLVEVLLGRASAPGHLPVRVAGVPRTGCAPR